MTDDRVLVMRIIDRLNVGGPAIHAVLTSEGLDPTRFRTLLVTGSVEPGEADMGDLVAAYGVRQIVIPSLGRELRPIRDIATAVKLLRVMRRERPHVVHTHKAKAGAVGRAVAFLARVPVIVHTYHGHYFRNYFGRVKTRVFLAIERTLARVTDGFVTLTHTLVDDLSNTYHIAPPERFTVVPLGFDLRPFAASDQHRGLLRRELGIAADARVRLVGIVGRMVPIKDHATFVAASAELAARHDDVRFVLVGGGELEAEVRRQVEELGLRDRTYMLGWRRDLERIYPDLDVLALSSLSEGTPVTLIEAMSCGVPVASTAVGGVAELLNDGRLGELCPPSDPTALAAAIERALTPEARARATAIRADILAAFDRSRLCRDLERLYDRLLMERRGNHV